MVRLESESAGPLRYLTEREVMQTGLDSEFRIVQKN
jgi:hypothetical protein